MTVFLLIGAINKDMKSKRIFSDSQFYKIVTLFDLLRNFSYTKSELMRDYYL